ncbi:MAG: cob(I)yrinic acid a,c-diamide adenosyltransferase [Deltaproteobacteria bacterium]|nr:MAG: cob(I)yrinic acid a,c-diamide adenosyltransferase [Deltaproteobacteria bacterium]
MKIYTKTGDQGETGLFGGERVRKSHARIMAYGDVDELNSLLGVCVSLSDISEIETSLRKIQNDLFDAGAVLATPDLQKLFGKASGFIREQDITFLETEIDRMEKDLVPLKNFILPGGVLLASHLQLARTVCRRAERQVVFLAEHEKIPEEVITYLNRLSDYLFVLARWVNFQKKTSEPQWQKK